VPATKRPSRYSQIIEHIFRSKYRKGSTEVAFERDDIVKAARTLDIELPKNLGDVVYSQRYRTSFPKYVEDRTPKGLHWVIEGAGRSKYKFVAVSLASIEPSSLLAETKVLDSTPGLIERYAFTDEQALLAKLRYNRLIDIFMGIACNSLQNHLRTTVPGVGQVETDEIYVGVDKKGVHYILPVQAKGGTDVLSTVQIGQDFALCAHHFSSLVCSPIAAQFMEEDLIALFSFELVDSSVRIVSERHYRLVYDEDLSEEELSTYRERPDE
jgi:hypothetical protein